MKNKFEPLKGKVQECLVEFDGELVRNREFRFQDLKSAVQGLLQEIQDKEGDINAELELILDGKKKVKAINRGALYGWNEALFWVKEKIRKWFADVVNENE